jgi:hypothetical protein
MSRREEGMLCRQRPDERGWQRQPRQSAGCERIEVRAQESEHRGGEELHGAMHAMSAWPSGGTVDAVRRGVGLRNAVTYGRDGR